MSESADVVVVGSGAGGAPVAYALAKAGASVVVLDRGKRLRRDEVVYDELRVARRDFFVPSAELDPHLIFEEGKPPARSREGWTALCVGGGTVHMSGFFYRFRPEDFRLRDTLGAVPGASVVNWPISYEELEPYYARVEHDIGVSGAPDEGPHVAPRSGPYPLPPVATHPGGRILDEVASKLGLRAFVTPRAVLSQPYEGRSSCHYHPLCGSFACHSGAKSSTLETYIPKAEATGKCRVIAEARVQRISVDDAGRATGVVYRDAEGHEHTVAARVVVVACSAVESARLLLLSTSQRFPKGLANGKGQVGRNLMFSTLSKAHGSFRFGKHAARDDVWRDATAFLGRSIADYYLAKDAKSGVRKGGGLNFLFPAGGPIFQSELQALAGAEVVWGKALKDRLHAYWHGQKQVDCETFSDFLPTPGTGVALDPAVKDPHGLPVARLHVHRHAHDLLVSKFLAERAAAILQAVGADHVWTSDIGGFTGHLPLGGCRMGEDAKTSVVDRNCRAHEVPNLYVSDGSVFPSSGGWPPTLTILANALRVGDAIADALERRDL